MVVRLINNCGHDLITCLTSYQKANHLQYNPMALSLV